jgi:hypothetical protein
MRQIAERRNGHWVLSAEQVRGAVDKGLEPLEIIEMLERMTGAPLDLTWEKRIKAWGQHYGEGQIAEVRLLRLAGEGVLRELRKRDTRLNEGLHPLPEALGLAVVNERDWDTVREALQEWGVDLDEVAWWVQSS